MIVAVTPFLALPLAHAWQRFGHGRLFRVAALLLWIVSVQNAYAYNTNLRRAAMDFEDDSFSGWKTTSMFPSVRRMGREDDGPLLTALWLGGVAVIAVGAWWRARQPSAGRIPLTPWRACAATTAVLLVGGVAAGALTRWPEGFRPELMIFPEDAKLQAFEYVERHGCALCVSSRVGVISERDISRQVRTFEFALDEPLHLSPDRDQAGPLIRWRLAALPPGPALLEIHARTEQGDRSIVLSVTVFDRGTENVLASREIRGDELTGSEDTVVPVYFTAQPEHSVRARLDYLPAAEVWVDRFLVVFGEDPPLAD
jgi:hypothetical protein